MDRQARWTKDCTLSDDVLLLPSPAFPPLCHDGMGQHPPSLVSPARSCPRVVRVLVVLAGCFGLLFIPYAELASTYHSFHAVRYPAQLAFTLKPRPPLNHSAIVVQPASANQTVTAILLHGLGDDPTFLPFVDGLSDLFPHVRWCALSRVTVLRS